ncbi:hypothetical protein MMYC01_209297 [Madurella mycetomatis]|uniref:Uncharacterized protein n=1 Tax=Madurella mycetomatis TaxID=100816 RepID=A0A175VYZ7_9PEZI|nr:hypothetical protein MMYC01_209297 [Madurella mycetomatis]
MCVPYMPPDPQRIRRVLAPSPCILSQTSVGRRPPSCRPATEPRRRLSLVGHSPIPMIAVCRHALIVARLADINVPEGIKANNIDDVGKGLLQLSRHPAVGDQLRRILEEWGTQVRNFVDIIAGHLGNREAGRDGVIPATGIAPPASATSAGPSDLRSVVPHSQSRSRSPSDGHEMDTDIETESVATGDTLLYRPT